VAGSSYSILRHTDYVDAVICHRYVITLFLLYKAWRGAGLQLRKQHGITSVLSLSLSPMAYITRLTKTSMLDALGQDYIRTAKAKGVHQYKIIFVHALRNALIPVITYVGPMIGGILTGSMVIESIFNIGGLGSKFVSCITNRDYTMIMATTLFLAVIMVGANLITDIVYKVIDPRIKLD